MTVKTFIPLSQGRPPSLWKQQEEFVGCGKGMSIFEPKHFKFLLKEKGIVYIGTV